MRVLEIGCGPGAAAREVARIVGPEGRVLAIDRSATAIRQATAGADNPGNLIFRQAPVEDFSLPPEEALFDLAFAVRVGALNGRHPALFDAAIDNIRAALVPGGQLFIDGGDPLKGVPIR